MRLIRSLSHLNCMQAHEQGQSVDTVVSQGPGLVFVVFPHALAKLPLPQLWSVIFFCMLILLGIDSQVKVKLGLFNTDWT